MIGWQPARMAGLALVGAGAASFSPNQAEAQVPCSYSVTILPDVDCGVWQAPGNAVAMNNNGIVIGNFIQCSGIYLDSFYWTGGPSLTVIPKPAWMFGFSAADINDDGLIVGTAVKVGVGDRAVIYNIATGQWTEIAPENPSNGWSAATGINNSGQVCGWRSIDDGGDPTTPQTAFIYDIATAQIVDLGLINGYSTFGLDINEAGAVCGSVQPPQQGGFGFLWDQESVTLIPVPAGSVAIAPRCLNESNHMVGAHTVAITEPPFQAGRAFVLNGFTIINLGMLPGDTSSGAADINDVGVVLGSSSHYDPYPTAIHQGFIWHQGILQDLTGLVQDREIASVGSTQALLNDGRILARVKLIGGGPHPPAILTPSSLVLGDVDGNCTVDVIDLLAVIYAWGSSDSAADVNDDEIVNVLDLLIVIQNWTVLP